MRTKITLPLLVLTCTLALHLVGCKSQPTSNSVQTDNATTQVAVKPYTLDKCVVSGEAFEHGKPYTFVYNGQEVKLCCKDCLADFNKDPQKYLAKINQAK